MATTVLQEEPLPPATNQRIRSVGLFLASFAGIKGIEGTPGTVDEEGKPLESKGLRYHSGPIKKIARLAQ